MSLNSEYGVARSSSGLHTAEGPRLIIFQRVDGFFVKRDAFRLLFDNFQLCLEEKQPRFNQLSKLAIRLLDQFGQGVHLFCQGVNPFLLESLDLW